MHKPCQRMNWMGIISCMRRCHFKSRKSETCSCYYLQLSKFVICFSRQVVLGLDKDARKCTASFFLRRHRQFECYSNGKSCDSIHWILPRMVNEKLVIYYNKTWLVNACLFKTTMFYTFAITVLFLFLGHYV